MTPRTIKVGTRLDLANEELTRRFHVRGDGTVTAVTLTTVYVRTCGGNFLHAPWSSVMGSTRYTYRNGTLVVAKQKGKP